MTDDELAELLGDCPRLYHAAARGAWPSIRRHGLLSTSALLDLWEIAGPERERLEAQRRPEGVTIRHPHLGAVLVRDQKPMDDAGLRRCLRDRLTPADWYRLLNARVFLWLTPARLHRLLAARPYRALEHDVLEIAAEPLVRAYREAITLCPINSGATRPFARERGRDTLLPIAAYPYAAWRGRRAKGERVVELSVLGGVPDVTRFVRRVTRMRGETVLDTLYEQA